MSADETTVTGSASSSHAPSRLMAVVEEDFDSDEEFCWAGDDNGWIFDSHPPVLCKSNAPVYLYTSCVAVEVICPVQPLDHPTLLGAYTTHFIILPKTLHAIIACMSRASISPGLSNPITGKITWVLLTTCFPTGPLSSPTNPFTIYKSEWVKASKLASKTLLIMIMCVDLASRGRGLFGDN
jgi:hypothetical protein